MATRRRHDQPLPGGPGPPANRNIPRADDGSLPQCWLLAEWPPEADEPTGCWLATLPAGTPIAELVRLARIRWRIEHDCCAPAQDPLRRDDPHRISRTHDRMLWW